MAFYMQASNVCIPVTNYNTIFRKCQWNKSLYLKCCRYKNLDYDFTNSRAIWFEFYNVWNSKLWFVLYCIQTKENRLFISSTAAKECKQSNQYKTNNYQNQSKASMLLSGSHKLLITFCITISSQPSPPISLSTQWFIFIKLRKSVL